MIEGRRDLELYAYKQQRQNAHLYAVPAKLPHKYIKKQKKAIKVKKKNPIVEFIRLSLTLSLLFSFGIFIFPTSYNSLVKQVVYPNKLNSSTGYINIMAKEDPAYNTTVNMHALCYPVSKYLNNGIYNNQLLLFPTIQKKHSEITTMYHTSELSALKNDLLNLKKQYPYIEPAIYVWEYDQGKYVDINAQKLYPAASIIKLPILVRMFKSIEANQFTIYDEMTFTEPYRSSGSGSMQFSQAGKNYSMDYLAKIMIQDSDNTSTNMIMSKMGGMEDVNAGLRDWGISTTYVRTWLPDLKGTNKTTAADIAKILYNLDNPGFLNVNSREYIIDYMSHVKNNRLIQAGLGEGALFIHKTGDIGTMLGDAGIVFAPNGKRYIVVILAERPYNSSQGKDFIVKASQIIYKAIVD